MRRLYISKLLLTFLSGLGLAAIAYRFINGLGSATNLSDAAPWGLWVGLDVMAGVALAAGGFVLCAIVYIFHLNKFRPLLRATVLTAFLGYLLVPIGLLIDLGLPWNIWHPMVHWQHHSFLFEVALCVMLYSTVLALEFFPVVLEHPLFKKPVLQKIYLTIKKLTIPLVIAGIMLSTLHQSSLGGLFLTIPFRTHPLWFSPIITLLFFISAIGLGLSVIIFESILTSYLYKHKPKMELLGVLGRASSAVLLTYLIIRIVDLVFRGKFSLIFDSSWQSNLFIIEILVSIIIPAVLFNLKQIRRDASGLFFTALLVICGFILNRLNISFITFARPEGISYFPSLLEIAASLGLFSGAFLVFLFFVEHVNLFDGDVHYLPKPDQKTDVVYSSGHMGPFKIINNISLFSLLFILSVAFGISLFNVIAKSQKNNQSSPTQKAIATADTTVLRIDNGDTTIFVNFNHLFHQDTLGKKESCIKCHHMSIKDDEVTPCYLCHKDTYQAKKIFDHINHQKVFEYEGNCKTCHLRERTLHTFTPCKTCHTSMQPQNFTMTSVRFQAPAYMDAMHTACINCHLKEWKKVDRATPDYCNTCHKGMECDIWREKYVKVETVADTTEFTEPDTIDVNDSSISVIDSL